MAIKVGSIVKLVDAYDKNGKPWLGIVEEIRDNGIVMTRFNGLSYDEHKAIPIDPKRLVLIDE